MLKKKIVRSLCTFSLAAACLAGAAVPALAWEEIIIDNETHRNNPSLVQGTYTDWTDLPYPWRDSEWPFVMNWNSRYTSTWDVGQARHGVAVWRVQIPKTGWYNLKSTYKETENRTTAAQYYVYVDVTIDDIRSYKGKPVYHETVDQFGHNPGAFHWAEFGAFCLKKGDVSVLVLDARETDRSSSADAAQWNYLGEVHDSKKCEDAPPPSSKKVIPPLITPLLFKK